MAEPSISSLTFNVCHVFHLRVSSLPSLASSTLSNFFQAVSSSAMEASIPNLALLHLLLLLLPSPSSIIAAVSDSEAAMIARHQLQSFSDPRYAVLPSSLEFNIEVEVEIRNPALRRAYSAFQALKNAIYSDPKNFTGNWVGPFVCSYKGVFCAPFPEDPSLHFVASVDLNGADIAGFLPTELALLATATVFHANSNRFCGVIPEIFARLESMFEFDVSNNRLVGGFPRAVLRMPKLKYLDLRYNDFEGSLPAELFEKALDALFVNGNRFDSSLPENFGNSTVSIAVLANNRLTGCIPRSIGRMANLNELILMGNKLDSCLPVEAGQLRNATVFDVGFNSLSGVVPESFAGMKNLEELDVSHNLLTGAIPNGVCQLPSLANFNFSYNYFEEAPAECRTREASKSLFDDSLNCISRRPKQRTEKVCGPVVSCPVDCRKFKCGYAASPPPPPSLFSSPPPPAQSPPPPPPAEIVLPPAGGFSYASPPPPMYKGY
ncbi:hypothetical protein HPP92_011537 [Vanilla planifolia]|uniref:Cell wall hydroxyproline-rich glycoprotein n=1 Tax=Vanilla planifolia TaxID=51239 RepID=A0A835RBN7_VANPL|nr:hypothetical protein HPP92_011537 [Vanilla planifolia]